MFNALKLVNPLVLRRCQRSYATSALFISDRSAQERPILTPTPDLNKKFQNVALLQENLRARRMDIDAVSLKDLWEVYRDLKTVRTTLEQRRMGIADQIKNLRKAPEKGANESMEKLRLEGRIVREDLKELLKAFWEVEEKMMTSCLLLPNDLHQKTPLAEELVLEECIINAEETESHLEATDLIDYRNPQCYYLKNEAADFDFALPDYFRVGLRSAGFIGMSGPDFAHSAVVEGCGTQPKTHACLEPTKDSFRLVGASSLYPFCAFYAKQEIPAEYLPKHFSVGRNYAIREGPGLFGVWQRNTVDFISFAEKPEDLEVEFEKTSSLLCSLYKGLEWNTRVVYVPAMSLLPYESLRLSFQMRSSSLKQWVEVGKVSMSGSYIPERMSMKIVRRDKSKDFCQLLSGTAVDVPLVLACILEQSGSNLFPSVLSQHILS